MSTKMNPEAKALWLAALRSGDFHQAIGTLHERHTNTYGDGVVRDQFCCLGVLCKLAVDAGVEVLVTENVTHENKSEIAYDGRCDTLPDSVIDWAGLDSADPDANFRKEYDSVDMEYTETDSLSSLNDDYSWTFAQIADAIDANL